MRKAKMIHKDEIHHQIMKKINLAVIVLTETKLIIDIENYEVNISDYRDVME